MKSSEWIKRRSQINLMAKIDGVFEHYTHSMTINLSQMAKRDFRLGYIAAHQHSCTFTINLIKERVKTLNRTQ
jgi:hypothetical protein